MHFSENNMMNVIYEDGLYYYFNYYSMNLEILDKIMCELCYNVIISFLISISNRNIDNMCGNMEVICFYSDCYNHNSHFMAFKNLYNGNGDIIKEYNDFQNLGYSEFNYKPFNLTEEKMKYYILPTETIRNMSLLLFWINSHSDCDSFLEIVSKYVCFIILLFYIYYILYKIVNSSNKT